MKNYSEYINKYAELFETYLDNVLEELQQTKNGLTESMVYSIKNGGKRLRPSLCVFTCDLLGVDISKALPFACSIEFIHSSSLVHDDLPALDNDDLRRGKPSCHKKFGEAEAILCGDAMLNFAYEHSLKNAKSIKEVKCLQILAEYTGYLGMLGGQYLDITSEKKHLLNKEILLEIQQNKTAKLITVPFLIASVLADEKYFLELKNYGENLGIAFQILDDVLDVEGNVNQLGKSIGKDKNSGKLTSVSIFGLEKSKELVKLYTQKAIETIDNISKLSILKDFALSLTNRIK